LGRALSEFGEEVAVWAAAMGTPEAETATEDPATARGRVARN
jgi:hypothetical protein